MPSPIQREVLLGPDLIARAALPLVDNPAVRWMLHQPREVRRTYVRDVIDRDPAIDQRDAQVAWMLRNPDRVRESYIEWVAAKEDGGPRPQEVWMLRQPRSVRESYVTEVLGLPGEGAATG